MSESNLIAEFTKCSGYNVPKFPEIMNEDETLFIIKMILDEVMELGATVLNSTDMKYNMIKMIIDSKNINLDIKDMTKNEIIAEQADAFVDIGIYMQNAACKKGINISKIFNIVHKSNMSKRFPDGTFHKREDGKIIKPPDFISPDIVSEILRQKKEGNELI